ncbi:MAG TPA: hypothetical protein VIN17_03105 [Paracoccaceae bacterium]|nr:hypothetical protein [Paracoccaceae bacterium]
MTEDQHLAFAEAGAQISDAKATGAGSLSLRDLHAFPGCCPW